MEVIVVGQHKFGVKVLHRQDFFNFIILAPFVFGDDIVCHTVQVGSSPSPENSATIAVEFQGNGHLACENIHTFCLFSSLQVLHWDLNYACLFILCHCGGKLIVISSIICHFSIFNLTTLKLHHKLSLTYTHTHYTLHPTHTRDIIEANFTKEYPASCLEAQ